MFDSFPLFASFQINELVSWQPLQMTLSIIRNSCILTRYAPVHLLFFFLILRCSRLQSLGTLLGWLMSPFSMCSVMTDSSLPDNMFQTHFECFLAPIQNETFLQHALVPLKRTCFQRCSGRAARCYWVCNVSKPF